MLPRLLLVEDHALFRGALALMLNLQPGMQVVAGCRALGGTLEAIDVALLDLALPDGEGTELVAVLRRANPRVGVLILSASVDPRMPERVAEAGADGALDKMKPPPEIAAALRCLAGGGRV